MIYLLLFLMQSYAAKLFVVFFFDKPPTFVDKYALMSDEHFAKQCLQVCGAISLCPWLSARRAGKRW